MSTMSLSNCRCGVKYMRAAVESGSSSWVNVVVCGDSQVCGSRMMTYCVAPQPQLHEIRSP